MEKATDPNFGTQLKKKKKKKKDFYLANKYLIFSWYNSNETCCYINKGIPQFKEIGI